MQVKIFAKGGWWKSPSTMVRDLESDVNAWLEANPHVEIDHVHRLSQPNFGWNHLALAVWYRGGGTSPAGS